MRSVFFPHLVNGPFGDPGLYVRIAHQGKALLFDCGELHALTTRELLKIEAVFVSHAHIDHLIGFDHLLRSFLYQDRRLLVHGPAGLIDKIAARLAGYTWNLVAGYPFTLAVREGCREGVREVLFRAGNRFRPEGERLISPSAGILLATPDWTVRACPLDHGDIVSFAYCLEETLHVAIHKDALDAHGYRPGPWLTRFKEMVRRGDAQDRPLTVPRTSGGASRLSVGRLQETIAHCERGMKLVYVTDVGPTAANRARITALAQDAHLLVIEAPFAHEDLARAQERHHLTARIAGQLARDAAVAKLLVFHHSPRYQHQPERLRHEAMQAYLGRPRES